MSLEADHRGCGLTRNPSLGGAGLRCEVGCLERVNHASIRVFPVKDGV